MQSSTRQPVADLVKFREPIFPGESSEYADARASLLADEIEARRTLTDLAEKRRRLPAGPIVRKDYRFVDADGAEQGLIDLFDGNDTLITYFWMYGPQRERPCPMCTDTLSGLNSVAVNIEQRAALKILGRSPVSRQLDFARERGWDHLKFVQTIGHTYAEDTRTLSPEGEEFPSFIVYQRDGNQVRAFYSAEMPKEAADLGQDPRGPTDLSPLWNVLDHTPEGRGENWYPKLNYASADKGERNAQG
jgi:predicted dithiol-disulfide oxidoreductase (DUF899 family)